MQHTTTNNNSSFIVPQKATLQELNALLEAASTNAKGEGKTVWMGRTIRGYENSRFNYLLIAIVSVVALGLLIGFCPSIATSKNLAYLKLGLITSTSVLFLSSGACLYYHLYLTRIREKSELLNWVKAEHKHALAFSSQALKDNKATVNVTNDMTNYTNTLKQALSE